MKGDFFVVYLYVNGSGSITRFGKRKLVCLLLFTCNYVVSDWRGFLSLFVLGMGYVISLWHSLSLHIIILKKGENCYLLINLHPVFNSYKVTVKSFV